MILTLIAFLIIFTSAYIDDPQQKFVRLSQNVHRSLKCLYTRFTRITLKTRRCTRNVTFTICDPTTVRSRTTSPAASRSPGGRAPARVRLCGGKHFALKSGLQLRCDGACLELTARIRRNCEFLPSQVLRVGQTFVTQGWATFGSQVSNSIT